MKNNVVLKPHVTEKSSQSIQDGSYTFLIQAEANKIEVKQYFLQRFNIEVESVRTIQRKPKERRRGRVVGKTAARKFAFVKFKKSADLEKIKALF